jgi:hypothetical protein
MVMGNRIGLYTEQTIGKFIEKDSKARWDIDELIDQVEAELLPEYKSIVDWHESV